MQFYTGFTLFVLGFIVSVYAIKGAVEFLKKGENLTINKGKVFKKTFLAKKRS